LLTAISGAGGTIIARLAERSMKAATPAVTADHVVVRFRKGTTPALLAFQDLESWRLACVQENHQGW
jgi:hypothetical protein